MSSRSKRGKKKRRRERDGGTPVSGRAGFVCALWLEARLQIRRLQFLAELEQSIMLYALSELGLLGLFDDEFQRRKRERDGGKGGDRGILYFWGLVALWHVMRLCVHR